MCVCVCVCECMCVRVCFNSFDSDNGIIVSGIVKQ